MPRKTKPKEVNNQAPDLFSVDNLQESATLLEVNWQFRASRALMTAHQLGFFKALSKPKTAARVAVECKTDARMTEKLLTVCCALFVLKRKGEVFSLTGIGADLLLPDSPRYAGGTLDHNEML